MLCDKLKVTSDRVSQLKPYMMKRFKVKIIPLWKQYKAIFYSRWGNYLNGADWFMCEFITD